MPEGRAATGSALRPGARRRGRQSQGNCSRCPQRVGRKQKRVSSEWAERLSRAPPPSVKLDARRRGSERGWKAAESPRPPLGTGPPSTGLLPRGPPERQPSPVPGVPQGLMPHPKPGHRSQGDRVPHGAEAGHLHLFLLMAPAPTQACPLRPAQATTVLGPSWPPCLGRLSPRPPRGGDRETSKAKGKTETRGLCPRPSRPGPGADPTLNAPPHPPTPPASGTCRKPRSPY